MSKTVTVLTYASSTEKSKEFPLIHGETAFTGMPIVAVLYGDLCQCTWCQKLRDTIAENTEQTIMEIKE